MKMHLMMGGKGGNMVELIFHESAFDHLLTDKDGAKEGKDMTYVRV